MFLTVCVGLILFSFAYKLKRKFNSPELPALIFLKKLPVRVSDSWKRDLNLNAQKIKIPLINNPETLAYFIVENDQDAHRPSY